MDERRIVCENVALNNTVHDLVVQESLNISEFDKILDNLSKSVPIFQLVDVILGSGHFLLAVRLKTGVKTTIYARTTTILLEEK